MTRTFLLKFSTIGILNLITAMVFGQTVIKESKIQITETDAYHYCSAQKLDLTVPILFPHSSSSEFSPTDIRNVANDSITRILHSIISEQFSYLNDDFHYTDLVSECDTTSWDYTNPESTEMHYRIGKNEKTFLSLEVLVDYVAGGNGNGFGTSIHVFNLDIMNNQTLTIDSLFTSTNAKKLRMYVSENIENGKMEEPNQGVSFDEDFSIFGTTGKGTGSFTFRGFTIDTNYLILSYDYDYGRGIGINYIKLPLSVISKFINKKYLWLCKTDK